MPIYEYECTRCGKRSEVVQKVSESPLRKCKSCGGALKKILSPPALHFKGAGWYVTDYARKSASGEEEKMKEKKKSDEPSLAKSPSEKKESSSSAKD